MRKFSTLVCFLAFCMASTAVLAWERSFLGEEQKLWVVEPLLWRNTMYGEARFQVFDGDTLTDQLDLDFRDDVGFGTKNSFGLRLATPIPFTKKRRWVITLNRMKNSGIARKSALIDGKRYDPNASLSLDSMVVDFTTNWNIKRTKTSYIDFIYGGQTQKISLDIAGSSNGVPESSSFDLPFPSLYVGLGGAAELNKTLLVDAFFKKFNLNRSGIGFKTLDYEINLGARLTPKEKSEKSEWLAFVGYRNTFTRFSFSDDRDNGSLKIGYKGPQFGIVGKF